MLYLQSEFTFRYVCHMIRRKGPWTEQGANNIVCDANDIFMRSLYGHNTSNYKAVSTMTVALTTHKAMSSRHKFDENIKSDSK